MTLSEGLPSLEQVGAVLATQDQTPVLGDFPRQGQAVLFRGFAVILALEECRAMPMVAVTSPVEVDLPAHDRVRFGGHRLIRGDSLHKELHDLIESGFGPDDKRFV